EDVVLTGADGLRAGVDVVEQMGNEVIVYLRLGQETLVARAAPHDAPRSGQVVNVSLRPDRLHFFDSASGERLS
ncbi:MAG: TOBE domain-containing protein, partial [candidate division WOR-3 bacterium]